MGYSAMFINLCLRINCILARLKEPPLFLSKNSSDGEFFEPVFFARISYLINRQ